jgi:beta-phosphoglucomutase-like phosphatase (HAD superfamily)
LKTIAVLFDMDGVLVDSEPIINAAAIRALAEFGIQARPGDFEPFVGAGEDRYVGGVAELHGQTYVAQMEHHTYDWYLKLLPKMGKAFPGARDLVEYLYRQGIACAVASNTRNTMPAPRTKNNPFRQKGSTRKPSQSPLLSPAGSRPARR